MKERPLVDGAHPLDEPSTSRPLLLIVSPTDPHDVEGILVFDLEPVPSLELIG
jgi:hypothetical protein